MDYGTKPVRVHHKNRSLRSRIILLKVFILMAGLLSFLNSGYADSHFKLIYSFTGTNGDGEGPYAGLISGPNGVLYGTTSGGGADSKGIIFSLTPPSIAGQPWIENILYDFASSTNPLGYNRLFAGLVIDKNGVLYGTTALGGSDTTCIVSNQNGCGAVFSLTPPSTAGGEWSLAILHAFHAGDNNGAFPDASLVIGNGGVLYGTTQLGGPSCGASYCGTVFSLTPPAVVGGAWTERVLYSFATSGPPFGSFPSAGVTIGKSGVLYGVAPIGGTANYGTVFSLTPPSTSGAAWESNIIYAFAGGSDGAFPAGGVVLDKHGVLYGTTVDGGLSNLPRCPGAEGCGTVFTLTPPATAGGVWTKVQIHAFTGEITDGAYPVTSLALSGNGVVYGTTTGAGFSGLPGDFGSAFSLTPPSTPGGAWTQTNLHTFGSGSDGEAPSGLLIYKRTLVGTTFDGGTSIGPMGSALGAVFALTR